MKWIDEKYTRKWPLLWQLVQKKYLFEIEFAYAVQVVPEGTEAEATAQCLLLVAARKGHLCVNIEPNNISPSLEELIPDNSFHRSLEKLLREGEKKQIYLPKYLYLETQIVQQIHRILRNDSQKTEIYSEIPELTQEQNHAVKNALQFPLSLILGGPGTGKTFTAAHIVKQFLARGINAIILTAPTGKASAHLADKIKLSQPSIRYGTLHSQLGLRPFMDKFQQTTWLDAELIIVDECSMIDAAIFARLLAAIGPNTHIVLMGDYHQLPSIEGGEVFRDLTESPIPKTILTKCYRSDLKEILNLARSILIGEANQICNIDLGFKERNIEKIMHNLWQKAEEHFPLTSDPNIWFEKLDNFRILSTLRKGPLGVDTLNAFFYEKFSKKTHLFPIIITRNDTKKTGLCNGDIGVLVQDKEAIFPGGLKIALHELPAYEYAYCLSVHKSQGSEYDQVLLLIPEGSENFGREILYTAITRAKTKIEIDGSQNEIVQALQKNSRRISGISQRLRTLCEV